ncbi:hypothetical protein MKX08_008157 [Trichoderma sp. CBMAI-0020]|nr:hypothetical protein MKX08_008157 [Trichoderma sp. CBMAI-0020]
MVLPWPFKAPAPVCSIEDIYELLVAVLPTFIALAEINYSLLEAAENSEALRSFYIDFKAKAYNLHSALHIWGPFETLQRLSAEDEIRDELSRVLHELETRFLSWNSKNARVCRRLGLQRKEGEAYPKLRALRRILPDDDRLDEESVTALTAIVRIDNNRAAKQKQLLRSLQSASSFLYDLQPSSIEDGSSCTTRFTDYPLQHIKGLTKTLFEVLSKNWPWPCHCLGASHLPQCPVASHVNRKTRLNLTQHQRFETAPRHGQSLSRTKALFRILFPTDMPSEHWQDTEIVIHSRESVYADSREVTHGVYEIIRDVRTGIRPRMAIFSNKLWQLEADAETNPSCTPRVHGSGFKSLKELLGPSQYKNQSILSDTERKDRLILSFILTTSLLHLIKGPWLQASLSNENICFLVLHSRSTPDITKPYLTANCTSTTLRTESRNLNQPHRFPDILSLGILLLEIARGRPIDFKEADDRCYTALVYLDKWKQSSVTVPDGLYRAIKACIEPKEFRGNQFDRAVPDGDFAIREYIFKRILFPLEEELSEGYHISLSALHDGIAIKNETIKTGSFDHNDEHQLHKQQAAKEWKGQLDGVHDLVERCMERCENMPDRESTRVKIAVLDTGLQLPESLQENYEAEGRVTVEASESFLPRTKDDADGSWRVDRDGHGSRVGQIILDVAPEADLHVARVFKSGGDLANPKMAADIYKSIAKAIGRATNEWKVDIIVMCFGFDKPIPLIQDAMNKAFKVEKPPLFFAATRNDGAHKLMAWPARNPSVIGISSTMGDGCRSTFNPSENEFHPILYALGEGVPVKITASDNPRGYAIKHVSGTSYATPVAAGLAANLLGCARMAVKASSCEDQRQYQDLPSRLQEMGGMLAVLKHRMCAKDVDDKESLLPWSFLTLSRLENNRLLEDINETLQHY